MELVKARQEFCEILKEKNIADYENNITQIFLHVLKTTKVNYILTKEITKKQYLKAKDLVLKRANNYPLQYLLKYVEFYGNKIKVNKNVLIPRNETEQLCDIVSKTANNKNVLDLCCGSGCLGLGIKANTNANVVLSDVSCKALKVAKHNAKINNLNVKFIKSDLFKNINQKFDIVVSNPPYIKSSDLNGLQAEVKFEPKLALDGKADGYYFYKKIIEELPQYLNKNGEVYFEYGVGQAKTIENLLKKNFTCIRIIKDYYNKNRFIYAKLKEDIC